MSTMDTSMVKLRKSSLQLSTMSSLLAVQREAIHNLCIEESISGEAKYNTFLSMKEKYATKETEYRMELLTFWNHLEKTEGALKDNTFDTPSVQESMEIESNDLVSSSTTTDHDSQSNESIAYTQDESDGSSEQPDSSILEVPEPVQAMKHRESVDTSLVPATRSEPICNPEPVPSAVTVVVKKETSPSPALTAKSQDTSCSTSSIPLTKEEFPALPRSRSKSKSKSLSWNKNTTKVTISTGVKDRDNGFTLWNKNKGRKMYTSTELYCTKTFGGNTQKLRRYLVSKGGFQNEQIGSLYVFQVRDYNTGKMVYHARIFVDGKMKDIRKGIEQIESQRESDKQVIWISRMKRNERSNKLMVRNFDILTGNDRRKLEALFIRFGPLDSGIKIGRDRNGVNFAVVTFRDGEAGLDCERAQNDGCSRKLKFNGRTLQIGYAAANETGNRRNNRSNWNKRRRS